MKIGNKCIQDLEFISRIDENIGPSCRSTHGTVLSGPGFHRSAGGGSYADNPASIFLRLIDQIRSFLGDYAVFAMHQVVCNVIFLYRPKGTQPHMKRYISHLHAHLLHLLQQFLRKVQPRRRCRRRADYLRVYRLISLPVLELFLNVRRQGHFPQPVQHLQKDPLIVKLYQPVSALQNLGHFRCQLSVTEAEPGSPAQMLPGPNQAFPGLITPVNKQQHLAGAASRQSLPEKSCRQHPGVVQNQAVSLVQIIRQIIKMPMLPSTAVFIQHQ